MLKPIKLLVAAIIFVYTMMVPSAAMAIEIGQTLPFERIQTLDGGHFEIPKKYKKYIDSSVGILVPIL